MLKWMDFSEQRIDDIISSKYLLDIQDITDTSLGDMFFDEEVDMIMLKNFMRVAAFCKLQKITAKKSTHIFTFGKCNDTVVDNCIRRDHCLIWYHYNCAAIKAPTNQSFLGDIDYFCYKCMNK